MSLTLPLTGIRVVEFAAIGPAPFAAMMLADLGATVLRIEKPGPRAIDGGAVDFLQRHRQAVRVLDLKTEAGRDEALAEVRAADAVVEGFRPGVMERLRLGPQACLEVQPRLVYGRVTGWGREGPLAMAAGHDINYLALSGLLGAMGPADGPPVPPLNLVADFGGGGMLLTVGIVSALLRARISGQGCVVDAAMLDGAALLGASIFGLQAGGRWPGKRGANLLDGGAPFYRCYRCADGRHVAVGAIEAPFYAELLQRLGITDPDFEDQWDRSRWPLMAGKLEALFATADRDHWCRLLEGSDACVSPVLSLDEAAQHPHNRARGVFTHGPGVNEPTPAPRFSAMTDPSGDG